MAARITKTVGYLPRKDNGQPGSYALVTEHALAILSPHGTGETWIVFPLGAPATPDNIRIMETPADVATLGQALDALVE